MKNLKDRANQLKIDIPAVCIALTKKETPWYGKVLAAITVCYAFSPIDLIPDFIPVLGYLDDIILLPMFIALTIKTIPKEVFLNCKEEAKGYLQSKKSIWYSIPIILIWCILLVLLLSLIIK